MLYWELYTNFCIFTMTQNTGTIFFSHLTDKKLRIREFEQFSWGHTATKWQSCDRTQAGRLQCFEYSPPAPAAFWADAMPEGTLLIIGTVEFWSKSPACKSYFPLPVLWALHHQVGMVTLGYITKYIFWRGQVLMWKRLMWTRPHFTKCPFWKNN